jgi:hypothetical protein
MRFLIPAIVAGALLAGGAVNMLTTGAASQGVHEVLVSYQDVRAAVTGTPCATSKTPAPRAVLTADQAAVQSDSMMFGHM